MQKELLNKVHETIEELVKKNPPVFQKTSFIDTGAAIYGAEEINAVIDTILEGKLGLAKKGYEFEEEFSRYIGTRKILLVNSGSSASLLAIEGMKKYFNLNGGEIITTACGFPTTLNPIIQLGFKPVFVDVDKTYNINPKNIENALTKDSKGIAFAHTLGNPANMEKIMEIADKNNLFVLEDCCDAYGSKYNGKMCGSFGTTSTFSFYPAHNITLAGEGGAVASNNPEIHKYMKSFRDWGRDCFCNAGQDNRCGKRFDFKLGDTPYDHKYVYSNIGYNLKPTEIQAAMGLIQLKKIESFNNIRKKNYNNFKEVFSGLEDHFELPKINSGADPVFFGLPLMIKNPKIQRQDLVKYLNKNGVGTRYVFGGNLLHQPAYKGIDYRLCGELVQTEKIFKNSLWIGIHPKIGEKEIDYIENQFKKYLKK